MNDLDILILGYNRPEHLKITLPALLDTCTDEMRVWIWQNGEHPETLAVVKEYESHPRVGRVHYSRENVGLRTPTNWLWKESAAEYVSKVDDDCLLPSGWFNNLRAYFDDDPKVGILGCWRFPDEDIVESMVRKKIVPIDGGRLVMRNAWVEGSGYIMRRSLAQKLGGIRDTESFTHFCVRATRAGCINGWAYPFLHQNHMDDPRAPISMMRTEADFERYMPLSAKNFEVGGLADWDKSLRNFARVVQEAPYAASYYHPLRAKARGVARRLSAMWKRVGR